MGPARPALAPCAKGTRARRRLGRMEYTHVGHLGLVVSRAVSRHHELRAAHPRGRQPHDHGLGARPRRELLRHRERLRAPPRVWERPRRSSGAGSTKGSRRRDAVVLATKVFGTDGRLAERIAPVEVRDHPPVRGVARAAATDRIDLYQMHHIDRDAWWDEIWEAMDQLKRQGKILYVGSSNFAGWHIARANEIANWRHSLGLATEQSVYNLLQRTVELEVIPAIAEYGMGMIPYSPLAGGLLAGALEKVTEGRRSQGYMLERDREQPDAARTVGSALQGVGRAAGRRRARVAAAPAGGDGADHRSPHRGAAARLDASDEIRSRRRARGARCDLPRAGRRRRPRPTPGSRVSGPFGRSGSDRPSRPLHDRRPG